MTDDDKALVERLRGDWPEILVEKHWMMDSDAIDMQREEAADRIIALEADVARLCEVVAIMHTAFAAYADSPAKKEAISLAALEARND